MNPFYSTSVPTDPMSQFLNAIFSNPLLAIIVALAAIILVIFIIREIVCWYWKINEIVYNLRDLNQRVKETNQILKRAFPEPEKRIEKPVSPEIS